MKFKSPYRPEVPSDSSLTENVFDEGWQDIVDLVDKLEFYPICPIHGGTILHQKGYDHDIIYPLTKDSHLDKDGSIKSYEEELIEVRWLELEGNLIADCAKEEYHANYKKVLVDGIDKKKQEAANMPNYG